MNRRLLVPTALLAIAGCNPADEPTPTPTPAAASNSPVSLAALVPSPLLDGVAFGSDPIPLGSFLYYEDFEKGTGGWELPPAPPAGKVGMRPLKAPACGGLWTIHVGLPEQKEYVPASGSWTLTKKAPLDLRKGKRPWFKYDIKGLSYPPEAVDFTAEIRPPGGAWQPVARRIKGGYMFMASIGADLTPWAGQQLGLRFVMTMKPGTAPSKGMYLDDIVVIEPQERASAAPRP